MNVEAQEYAIDFHVTLYSVPMGNTNVSTVFNPLRAKFSKRNINIYYTFYVIPPKWYDKGSWNPSWSKTRAYLFYIGNIMAADVLATQGARASSAMILT